MNCLLLAVEVRSASRSNVVAAVARPAAAAAVVGHDDVYNYDIDSDFEDATATQQAASQRRQSAKTSTRMRTATSLFCHALSSHYCQFIVFYFA